MPAKHTLHVALTEQLVQYVRDQVTAGRHMNASEAVRCALNLLMEHEAKTIDQTPALLVTASARRHG